MPVSLRAITKANFKECIGLKVRDDQRFVASNVYSLAEAKVGPEHLPLAIYHGDTMVGFLMYELNHPAKELSLSRFMIDQRFQHRGFGRGALELLREIAMEEPGIERMALSTKPDNAYGIRVYERFGFTDTGVLDDGEEVFVLDLGKRSSHGTHEAGARDG